MFKRHPNLNRFSSGWDSCSEAKEADSYQKWYNRHTLLASFGVVFEYRDDYKEGDIVTADCRGITLRFPYTEAGTDRCFYALLKAEYLQKHPVRRTFYKVFHWLPGQTTFDTDNSTDWEKAVRAVLGRMAWSVNGRDSAKGKKHLPRIERRAQAQHFREYCIDKVNKKL